MIPLTTEVQTHISNIVEKIDNTLHNDREEAIIIYKESLKKFPNRSTRGLHKDVINYFGKILGEYAEKNLEIYIDFTRQIWTKSNYEGRYILTQMLSTLTPQHSQIIIPFILELVTKCSDWSECDNLAYAMEFNYIKNPEEHFRELEEYLKEENKWIKRLVIVILGRIWSKHPNLAEKCLILIRTTLTLDIKEIRTANSWILSTFGMRNNQKVLANFIEQLANETNSTLIWIMCDTIRRNRKSFSNEFLKTVIPIFENWHSLANPRTQKTLYGALKKLKSNK